MNIEFSIGSGKAADPRPEGAERHLLVIGRFSGSREEGERAAAAGAVAGMIRIDPVDIDDVMASVQPQVRVRVADQAIALSFADREDFHPDKLLKSLPAFRTMLELRRSLQDPGKSAAAATLARQLLGLPAESRGDAPSAAEAVPETSDDLFARLLGRPAAATARTSPAVRSALDALLAEAVGDASTAAPDPAATELVAALDTWLQDALRELLASAEFRAVESSWRCLAWLGENLDDAVETTVWLVDADPRQTGALLDELPRRIAAGPGSVERLLVLHEFADTADDLERLQQLAKLASELGATAFAAADGRLAGVKDAARSAAGLDGSDFDTAISESFARTRAGASRVCLGFPGFLLRQPYGSRGDPVDTIDFEELEANPARDDFLWGNAGVLLAVMSMQDRLILGDFPLVVYEQAGGQAIMPATGAYLSDSAADAVLARGIVPLLASRRDTSIRVPRLQSLAITPA